LYVGIFNDIHSSVFTAGILIFSTNCSYRGGVDIEGRPVMVVVGAHFLLRCLDLERFVLHVVKVMYLDACVLKPWISVSMHSEMS
jgi:hypothetical protein